MQHHRHKNEPTYTKHRRKTSGFSAQAEQAEPPNKYTNQTTWSANKGTSRNKLEYD